MRKYAMESSVTRDSLSTTRQRFYSRILASRYLRHSILLLGTNILAVYLHQYQLVPLERTVELLQDVCGCRISEGTLTSWEQEAASRLEPTMEQIAERVACSPLQHEDETGMRLGGKLHWVHVNSTRFLTHLAWHQKRGRAALEAIGIWPPWASKVMPCSTRSLRSLLVALSRSPGQLSSYRMP